MACSSRTALEGIVGGKRESEREGERENRLWGATQDGFMSGEGYKRTNTYTDRKTKSPNTFPSHADFKAFFEAAVLTLIAVVLVDWTIPVGTACVSEVPSYAPFEEAFAPLASKLAIVFATGFIPTDHTLNVLWLFLRLLRRLVRRRGLCVVRGSLDRRLRGRRGDLRGCQIQLAWLRGGKR